MVVRISDAVTAYQNAAKAPRLPASSAAGDDPAADFSALVKQAAGEAVASVKRGEDMSIKAIAGKADIQEVVQAVAAAEMTLETVTTVRDKVIQAYNEILRMPI